MDGYTFKFLSASSKSSTAIIRWSIVSIIHSHPNVPGGLWVIWVYVSQGFLWWIRRTQYISEIRRFYNEWEDCGMHPTVKIFLEIFWDGINDTSGAVYPFESMKLCWVKNDNFFFCSRKALISSKTINQILNFMRVLN